MALREEYATLPRGPKSLKAPRRGGSASETVEAPQEFKKLSRKPLGGGGKVRKAAAQTDPRAEKEAKDHPAKKARANRRKQVYGPTQARLRDKDRTVLEEHSIGATSSPSYMTAILAFLNYLGVSSILQYAPEKLDDKLAGYFAKAFMEGEGHAMGNTLFAALR